MSEACGTRDKQFFFLSERACIPIFCTAVTITFVVEFSVNVLFVSRVWSTANARWANNAFGLLLQTSGALNRNDAGQIPGCLLQTGGALIAVICRITRKHSLLVCDSARTKRA